MIPTIYCADVGSIPKGNFAWAQLQPSATACFSGTDIRALAESVVAGLDSGQPIALGFECPMFVPVRTVPEHLSRARSGEGSRSWSAGAGPAVLATGLVQSAWLLETIRSSLGTEPAVFLDWGAFAGRGSGLFVWEALVSGAAKTGTHTGDAEAAVLAFRRALPDPRSRNCIAEPRTLSLVAAALLWSGWNVPPGLLRQPSLVVAA